MTDTVKIWLDPRAGRFIISAPQWMVNKTRAIPNRRWDPRTKFWTAPAIYANANYLRGAFPDAVYDVEARKKLDDIIARHDHMHAHAKEASGFPHWYKFKLEPHPPWDHQIEALHKIYPLKAWFLDMDMRTGKSRVGVDYACAHYIEGNIDTTIIITKVSIRGAWKKAWADSATVPLSLLTLRADKPKLFDEWQQEAIGWQRNPEGRKLRVLIVGTESMSAGRAYDYVQKLCLSSNKVLIIQDESHDIGTHDTIRTKKIVALRKLQGEDGRRGAATGTPVSNGPMKLYSQFEFLDPDIIGLGDFYSFKARYAVMGGFEDKQIVGYQNMDELTQIIAPFTYQARKGNLKAFAHIPKMQYLTREVPMSAKQRALYKSMAKERYVEVGAHSLLAKNVLEKMQRLQEICGGFVSVQVGVTQLASGKEKIEYQRSPIDGPNPKLTELLNVIEEMPDVSTIMWAVWTDELRLIASTLRAKYGADAVVEVHGDIDEAARNHNVYDLFLPRKARFLVGNPAVGGLGLEMGVAELVIRYSNSFNYVFFKQSEERTQSAMQTMPVMNVSLECEDSVDNDVAAAMEAKEGMSEYVRRKVASGIAPSILLHANDV